MRLLLKTAIGLYLLGPGAARATGIEAAVSRLDALLQAPDRGRAEAVAEDFVQQHIAVGQLTQATFGNYLEEALEIYEDLLEDQRFQQLVAHHRARLVAAYRARLAADLAEWLAAPGLRGLQLESVATDNRRGQARLSALFPDGPVPLQARLAQIDGRWKITELVVGKKEKRVSARFRHLFRDALDESYSPPVLEAQLAERDYVILDDFTATWDGRRPMDWGPFKKKDRLKPMLYHIERSGDRHYMTARDSTYSVIVGKFVHWNPREYPILSWCWRANVLPPGGNEFLDDMNDSAAGIYVIFSRFLGIPKQLKYVWSTTLPEGTVGRRDKIFRPWFFVVESGEANLGKWTFETVDLVQHHRAKLGGQPADRTIGLGLLTDANSTRAYAEANYADLRVWTREAFDGGRVINHCGGLPQNSPHNAREAATGSAYGAEE